MNEIVQMVVQRTGVPEDKAREAVQVVLEHLRSRLPGPIASQLDSYIQGGSQQNQGGTGGIGDLLKKVG